MSKQRKFDIEQLIDKVPYQMVLMTNSFTMEELLKRSKEKNVPIAKVVSQMIENQICLEIMLEVGAMTNNTGIEEVIEFLRAKG